MVLFSYFGAHMLRRKAASLTRYNFIGSRNITYGMIWLGEIFVVTPIYIGLKFSSFSSLSGKYKH